MTLGAGQSSHGSPDSSERGWRDHASTGVMQSWGCYLAILVCHVMTSVSKDKTCLIIITQDQAYATCSDTKLIPGIYKYRSGRIYKYRSGRKCKHCFLFNINTPTIPIFPSRAGGYSLRESTNSNYAN